MVEKLKRGKTYRIQIFETNNKDAYVYDGDRLIGFIRNLKFDPIES